METAIDSNWPELEKEKITSSEVFEIEGKHVSLTKIGREVWNGIPKAQLIKYQHAFAPYILLYLACVIPHASEQHTFKMIRHPTSPLLHTLLSTLPGHNMNLFKYLKY